MKLTQEQINKKIEQIGDYLKTISLLKRELAEQVALFKSTKALIRENEAYRDELVAEVVSGESDKLPYDAGEVA